MGINECGTNGEWRILEWNAQVVNKVAILSLASSDDALILEQLPR